MVDPAGIRGTCIALWQGSVYICHWQTCASSAGRLHVAGKSDEKIKPFDYAIKAGQEDMRVILEGSVQDGRLLRVAGPDVIARCIIQPGALQYQMQAL